MNNIQWSLEVFRLNEVRRAMGWDIYSPLDCGLKSGSQQKLLFSTQLHMFRYRNAHDDRDRLYGLLGLLDDTQTIITPNYSNSVERVFTDAVPTMIKAERSLNVLAQCCVDNPLKRYNLPSWAQDWSSSHCSRSVPFRTTEQLFNATRSKQPVVTIGHDSTGLYLKARGFEIDRIRAVASIDHLKKPSKLSWPEKRVAELFRVWVDFLSHELPKVEPRLRIETLCRTILCDSSSNSKRADQGLIYFVVAWTRSLNGEWEEFDRYQQTFGDSAAYVAVVEGALTFATEMPIFVTERGLVGVCCEYVKQGDEICLLFGGCLPFLLRPYESELGKRYQICGGECYVHGLADGEGMLIAARESALTYDFVIL